MRHAIPLIALIGGDLTDVTLPERARPDVSKPACLCDGAACNDQAQNDRAVQSFPGHRIQINWHADLQVEFQLGRVSERTILVLSSVFV